jgi:hypothetical protein
MNLVSLTFWNCLYHLWDNCLFGFYILILISSKYYPKVSSCKRLLVDFYHKSERFLLSIISSYLWELHLLDLSCELIIFLHLLLAFFFGTYFHCLTFNSRDNCLFYIISSKIALRARSSQFLSSITYLWTGSWNKELLWPVIMLMLFQ